MAISLQIKREIEKNDPKITSIDLSNRNLNDNDISELQELLQGNKYISTVNLANNNFTKAGCQMLRLVTTLKSLNISGCYAGDEGVSYFIDSNIKHLDISNCGVTSEGAEKLFAKISQFKSLNIDKNPRISDDIAQKIRQKFLPDTQIPNAPVVIDLGLNGQSFYEFLNRGSSSSTVHMHASDKQEQAPEELLAETLLRAYDAEMAKMSPSDRTTFAKELFLRNFCKNLGVEVEIKSNNPLRAS